MTLSLRYAARSDVGLVRAGNEDSGYAGPRLLVVADGMGGHAAGEVASSIVVSSIAALDDDDLGGDLLDALAESVAHADDLLRSTIAGDAALDGMGTTLTALLWSGSRVGLVHVGDSRAYLLRGGDLLRLTHDHTYVQTLVDSGQISVEEAESHPRRSLLMRALDGRNPAQPDLSVREVRAGDRFMVCSDGLSGVVSESTLLEALAVGNPADAAERLIAFAKRAGGPDNITVVVADVVDADDRPDTVAVVVGAAGEPELAERAAEIVDASPAAKAHQQLGAGSVDREKQRAADRVAADAGYDLSSRRRRWFRRSLIVVVIIGLLVAGGAASLAWINTQYYVAVQDGGVAVFRGVNQQVGSIQMSKAVDLTDVRVDLLPEQTASQVESGINATSQSDAEKIVDRLRGEAASCAVISPPAGCPIVAPGGISTIPTVNPEPTGQPIPAPSPIDTNRFLTPQPSTP